MTNDYAQGLPVTDYAMILLHQDTADDRWVLIIAGLSGFSTKAAAEWLASNKDSLTGSGMVLKFIDTQGDGVHETITIQETIEFLIQNRSLKS